MEKKGIIINVLAVLVVLGIVFFSQQGPKTQKTGSNNQANGWWQQIQERFSNEAQSRGGELQQVVTQQKDIAAKTVWEKIKIYFAEKFSKFSGTKVE